MERKILTRILLSFALILELLAPTIAEARLFGRRVIIRRGPSRFVSSGVPSRRVVVNQGRGNVVVNRGNNNVNDVKEIPGFSSLAQLGNDLLERDRFGNLRRLFIDPRSGQLIGATERETIRQLREFYLTNIDKFNGGNLDLVRRFLAANGSGNEVFGILNVDLRTGVMPQYDHMAGRDDEVRTAALNFVLNFASQSSQLLRTSPANIRADGTMALNLQGAYRTDALALMTNDNPYACSRTGREPARLDWLISRVTDPNIYNQLVGVPAQYKDFAAQLGIEDDKRKTAGNKIVIAAPPGGEKESIVGIHPQRLLEVQSSRTIPGGSVYVSYDNIGNPSPGVQTDSRDIFKNGINATFDAGEMIFHRPNGFLGFALYQANGARANEAPASIALASANAGLGEVVATPQTCLVCHRSGFLGGGISKATNKPYTDNLGKIPSFHQQFFTNNASYNARKERDSQVYLNALRNSGSFVPESREKPNDMAALLPDFLAKYRSDLDLNQAGKELGVPAEAVGRILGGGTQKIPRALFEQNFCGLKAALGGAVAGGAFQNPVAGSVGTGGRGFSLRGATHDASFSGGTVRRFAQ